MPKLQQISAQVRKLVAEDHELGNHSVSVSRMALKCRRLSPTKSNEPIIRQTRYQGAIYFCPPFDKKAVSASRVFVAIFPQKHYPGDSYPEIAGNSEKIVEPVPANAKPGSIISPGATYSNSKESLKSVRGIIGLKNGGYEFKTVSELMASAN